MKSFLKFFTYGVIFSGLILGLSYLLNYAPLDPKNGSIFSNGFFTGVALWGWGANRIRSNQNLRSSKTDIERMTDSQIPSALGLFLAGSINLSLFFFL